MSCPELDLSKIARIEAFPQGAFKIATPVYMNEMTASGVSIPTTGKRLMFSRDTAKFDDNENVSVSGRTHKVVLSWKFRPITKDEFATVKDLQNNPHELLVTYFGGTQRIVRTDPDQYLFTSSDDDGSLKCKMTLVNGQGFTRIV